MPSAFEPPVAENTRNDARGTSNHIERTGSSYDLKQAQKADRSFIINHIQPHMLFYVRGASWPSIEIAQSQNDRTQCKEREELKERVTEKIFFACGARQVFKIEKTGGAGLAPWPRIC